MANTIKLKRGSGSDPSASDLSVGELAVRTDNGKLFTKKDDNSVAEISGSGGGASALNDLSDAKTDNSDLAIGIGVGALAADDGGNSTLAIGKDALNDQTSGNFNCGVGVEALSKVTDGNQNMAFGVYAGRRSVGSSNVFVGYSAGEGASSGTINGSHNLALGEKAMENYGADANNNVAIGTRALREVSDGTDNSCIGYYAGTAITSGDSNQALGSEALLSLTSGFRNIALGYRSLKSITTTGNNIGIGHASLQTGTGFEYTIALGSDAGGNQTGNHNIFMGNYAGRPATGNNNVAIGKTAFNPFGSGVSGENNVAIGIDAAGAITSGSNNTILGPDAGDALTEGSNNIILGHDAAASSATVSNEITFGDTNITKLRVPALNFEITANAVTNGAAFYENAKTVAANYTLSGSNAMAAGPITINSSVTVTVSSGDTLTII